MHTSLCSTRAHDRKETQTNYVDLKRNRRPTKKNVTSLFAKIPCRHTYTREEEFAITYTKEEDYAISRFKRLPATVVNTHLAPCATSETTRCLREKTSVVQWLGHTTSVMAAVCVALPLQILPGTDTLQASELPFVDKFLCKSLQLCRARKEKLCAADAADTITCTQDMHRAAVLCVESKYAVSAKSARLQMERPYENRCWWHIKIAHYTHQRRRRSAGVRAAEENLILQILCCVQANKENPCTAGTSGSATWAQDKHSSSCECLCESSASRDLVVYRARQQEPCTADATGARNTGIRRISELLCEGIATCAADLRALISQEGSTNLNHASKSFESAELQHVAQIRAQIHAHPL